MRKGYTDISMVLDRSGSMDRIWMETIGGINTYIDKQKAVDGECRFTLAAFDDEYYLPFSGRLVQQIPKLVIPTLFEPRGFTALYDAIGKTIAAAGQRFAALKEDERPEKVLFCIVTDGGENASKEYTKHTVAEMIKHQTDQYGWDFTFLAANIDAAAVGGAINIAAGKTMSYAHTGQGAGAAFTASSNYATRSRTAATPEAAAANAFTAEDIQEQIKAGLKQP